jgi:hypothetical protein
MYATDYTSEDGSKATLTTFTQAVMHRIAEMRDELYEMDGEIPPERRAQIEG